MTLTDLSKEELIEIICLLLEDLDEEHMDVHIVYWKDICEKYNLYGYMTELGINLPW